MSNHFQLYSGKRLSDFKNEVFDVSKVIIICIIAGVILGFFIRDYPLSRVFLFDILIMQIFGVITFRYALRTFLKVIRVRGKNYRQVLFIGRNIRSAKMLDRIKESPEFGIRILGFLDTPNNIDISQSFPKHELLGDVSELEKTLREKVVDEVFIFLPIKSHYSEIQQILETCEKVGVEVKLLAEIFNLNLSRSMITQHEDINIINIYTTPRMGWQLTAKRLLDIMVSAILLFLHMPIILLVSVLIKITSRGNVFFLQERLGYNGRPFNCIKFRTMVENAEEMKGELLANNEMDGPVFKMKADPRVTPIGRFLRKTSLDELPQLINVLLGDMSLVGPRPPIPSEVDQYVLTDIRRLSMKPGITCIWQVSGRNNISFDKWMELDRHYIDNWSFWLDIKILAKTIEAVIKGSGAS
jgi:exopolysaccharide biosynthesis polyprenyl glycosylphosphotransferase